MPVVSLVSAKGSPGVSTTAAGLAAVGCASGRTAVWVELDPSGGTGWVQSRESCPRARPVLADVTRVVREGSVGAQWQGLTVEAPPAVPAVLAPADRRAASTLIADGGAHWNRVLGVSEAMVVVDCGRWEPEQRSSSRIAGSDVVGLVCRSTIESIEHARHLVDDLGQAARCPVAVVVVGTQPYAGGVVADALGAPLAGVLEWRRGDVALLWARGACRQLARSLLGRSAWRTLGGLVDAIPAHRRADPTSDGAVSHNVGYRARR